MQKLWELFGSSVWEGSATTKATLHPPVNFHLVVYNFVYPTSDHFVEQFYSLKKAFTRLHSSMPESVDGSSINIYQSGQGCDTDM